MTRAAALSSGVSALAAACQEPAPPRVQFAAPLSPPTTPAWLEQVAENGTRVASCAHPHAPARGAARCAGKALAFCAAATRAAP